MIHRITGQLVLWDKGLVIPNEERHAVMVFGILAFPPDAAALWCHNNLQRTFHGIPETLALQGTEDVANIPDGFRGGTPSTYLTAPIWRV